MRNRFYFILFVLFSTSCVGPKHLQKKLNRNQYPLGYLHDSPIVKNKIDVSISPLVFDKSDTTNVTRVKKESGHFLFLLFFYEYNYKFTVSLGKNSIKPELVDFIRSSFIKESERSGIYFINDTSRFRKYKLNIDILNYSFESKYYKEGSYDGRYRKWSIDVRPSFGTISLHTTLHDYNNKEIFSKTYKITDIAEYVKSRSKSEYEINENMMQNMTETLALCIKKDIAEMVSDINIKVR